MSEQDKIAKIYDAILEIKTYIAKSEVHIENHAKDIADLQEQTEKIEADRNWAYGIFTVIGLAMTALFSWIFKHF